MNKNQAGGQGQRNRWISSMKLRRGFTLIEILIVLEIIITRLRGLAIRREKKHLR